MASAVLLLERVYEMLDTSDTILLENGDEIEPESQALVGDILPVMGAGPPQLRAFAGGNRFEWMSGPVIGTGLYFTSDERAAKPGYQIYLTRGTAVVPDEDLVTLCFQKTSRGSLSAIAKSRTCRCQSKRGISGPRC